MSVRACPADRSQSGAKLLRQSVSLLAGAAVKDFHDVNQVRNRFNASFAEMAPTKVIWVLQVYEPPAPFYLQGGLQWSKATSDGSG